MNLSHLVLAEVNHRLIGSSPVNFDRKLFSFYLDFSLIGQLKHFHFFVALAFGFVQ
jgi:hypothetical protein